MKLLHLPLLLILLITCLSCEKPTIPENYMGDADGNLVVSIFQIEQQAFAGAPTRAEVSDFFNCLNFAVYDAQGKLVKQVNQKISNAGFGTAAFAVGPGTYQIVVVGHSSGNPTMTDPLKIKFANSDGYTDTFLYSTTVTVNQEGEEIEVEANLYRITSLCRVVFTDTIPDKVTQIAFEYKGGSGAFNATTGLGSVNSTQKMTFEVEPGQTACSFDLYTILRDTEATLHLQATATDADKNVVRNREFEVPMKQRTITKLSGPFFAGSSGSTISIVIGIDTEWEGEQTIDFE